MKILIVYTGGTIGMVHDPETGALKPFDFEHLRGQIPELKRFDYQLDVESFAVPIDSSDMKPEVWVKLAQIIEKGYETYDGFVVLHGSDTMAYTASALSFLLEGLAKPVILTGSQLPIGMIRTDGKENLITAIEIAAARKGTRAIIPEVAVYFEYELHRGNRSHKINAEHFDAFISGNYPKLAEAGVHIDYNESAIRSTPELPFQVHTSMDSRVGVLKIFPGMTHAFVQAVLHAEELKGVVLETFGAGNVSKEPWLLEELEGAVQRGMALVNVTQCAKGAVMQGAYENSYALERMGIINGKDMTTEAALTKMMFLLGQGLSGSALKEKMEENLRGEIA